MICQINPDNIDADYLIQMGRKKKSSLGCLFWIAIILLIIVIFLFNRENIQNVIKKTNFKSTITNLGKKEKPQQKPEVKIITKKKETKTAKETPKTAETVKIKIKKETPITKPKTTEKKKRETHIRKARIFYAYVDKEGKIYIKGIIKPVEFIDSPLKKTLLTLLKGPNPEEMNRGFLTLIPRETKIKNIYIKGDTAYIDFSEDFRFNPLGVEGLKNQLKQVVYTVTEFHNIKRVQILINGKIEKYLGPEGIFIGKPLSRNSFQEE